MEGTEEKKGWKIGREKGQKRERDGRDEVWERRRSKYNKHSYKIFTDETSISGLNSRTQN
jgi:hypothetical protein